MHGGKKCGHLSGKVLVPIGEHVNRLIATRFQWDLMGTENMVIARTDSETGKLISSTVDIRDHEFILGVTNPDTKPLSEVLFQLEQSGATAAQINAAEAEWMAANPLTTFNDLVISLLKDKPSASANIDTYLSGASTRSLTESRALAHSLLGHTPYFSWDAPRTREGYYHYRAGIPAAIKRSIAFAPHADLLWLETKTPDVSLATSFARSIRSQLSALGEAEKNFVYNLSPSFNWLGKGFTEEKLKAFVWDLAKEGFVLQLISLAGLHSGATITHELSQAFKTEGMKAYVDLVQRREKENGCDVLTHQKWSGANYIDGILQGIQAGSSGTSAVGSDSTENQFK